MGMSDNMLACIRAIAENRIQDAKQYAICCCVEDGTKKNEGKVQYYKKLLENGSDNVMEVPMNIKGLEFLIPRSRHIKPIENKDRVDIDTDMSLRKTCFKSVDFLILTCIIIILGT